MKLTFYVTDKGLLPESIRGTLKRVVPTYAGKKVQLTIEEYRDTASDAQRKYYFKVIVPAYIKHFGGECSKEQMHNSMMREIGGFSNEYVNPFTGESDEGRKSFNDLTKAQAEGYFTLCRKWAAENGFDIPEPNEY